MSNAAYEMLMEQLTTELTKYIEDEDNKILFAQWESEK